MRDIPIKLCGVNSIRGFSHKLRGHSYKFRKSPPSLYESPPNSGRSLGVVIILRDARIRLWMLLQPQIEVVINLGDVNPELGDAIINLQEVTKVADNIH